MRVACRVGLHDYIPVPPVRNRWTARCSGCGKESKGVDVTPKPLRFVKPTRSWEWRVYWRERLGLPLASYPRIARTGKC